MAVQRTDFCPSCSLKLLWLRSSATQRPNSPCITCFLRSSRSFLLRVVSSSTPMMPVLGRSHFSHSRCLPALPCCLPRPFSSVQRRLTRHPHTCSSFCSFPPGWFLGSSLEIWLTCPFPWEALPLLFLPLCFSGIAHYHT